MHTTRLPAPSTLRAAGAICGLVATAMLVGVPAGAAPADPPQLSIAVDNGHSSTAAGDTLDSAITVRNLGTTKIVGLKLTQTMPTGLVFGSADAAGVAGPDGVSWTVDLAPTAEAVVRSTMTVSDTPPDLLRLATVACAAASADGPPIVCASDSDQLPAGAAAEAAIAADESAAASTALLRWYLAGGAVLVVAAVAVLLLIRRRRRALHLMRTTTVMALFAVVAVGTWSSTAPPVAAAPSGPAPAVATTGIAALSADVSTAAVPRRDLPVGGPAVADPTGSAPASTTPVPQPEPGMQLAGFTAAAPSDRAAIAVTSAMTQIGLPYVWGGNGPRSGDAGFDCSGLTTFAYATAGVALPRTAHTQFYAGPHLAGGTALQPGDLVFYGTPSRVHHVGMFIGQGRMVNAPTFGKPVQTAYYRWAGDDFLGSTRPAATGQPTTGLLPYYAPPADDDTAAAPTTPPVFLAPPAPPLPETAAPPEPAPLAGTVLPVPLDDGSPATTATPGASTTTAPTTTASTPTTAPTTAPTITTAPTTTARTTTASTTATPTPATTASATGPARPALVPPVVPVPAASTSAAAP